VKSSHFSTQPGRAFARVFATHFAASAGLLCVSTTAVVAAATADTVKISGVPASAATTGTTYGFKPTASDSEGHTLSYSIKNKPAWASFSIYNGLLWGTPLAAQAGHTYADIVISASDGKASAALPPFSITVSTVASRSTSSAATTTLAEKHPGDVGMGTDPAVVLYENFTAGSVPTITARYNTVSHTAGMALVADHPVNSPGTHAMRLTSCCNSPSTSETYLYKDFGAGYDELYFRYYIKYLGNGPWHHSGLWFGGYNPSLPYPYPHAGERPVGNDRYSIALEPITTFKNVPMDFYVYWRGMHSWMADPSGPDAYYGNTFLHNPEFRMESNTWVCYEIHLKLNPNPENGTGAMLQVWKNDALVQSFDDSGPPGYWIRDKFCPNDAQGAECTEYRPANPKLVLLDQQWRTTAALKINYFWPQNYNNASVNSSLLLDDMVVAKERIGCTVKR
jgi:Putative Ig domain